MLNGINLVKSYYNMRMKQSRPQHICFKAIFPAVVERLKSSKHSLRVENALRTMLTAVPHLDLVTIEQLGAETWAQTLVRHGMGVENTQLTNALMERRTKLAGMNPHRYIAPPTIHESAVFYQVSEHTPGQSDYGPASVIDEDERSGSSTPTPGKFQRRAASKPAERVSSSLDPSISLEHLARPNNSSAEQEEDESSNNFSNKSSIPAEDESDFDTYRPKKTRRPARNDRRAAPSAHSLILSSNSAASPDRRDERLTRILANTTKLLQKAKERNTQLALIRGARELNPQARSAARDPARPPKRGRKAVPKVEPIMESVYVDDDGEDTIRVLRPGEKRGNEDGNPTLHAMIADLSSRESSVASDSPIDDDSKQHEKYTFSHDWPPLSSTFHSHTRSLIISQRFPQLHIADEQRNTILAELVSAQQQDRTPFTGGGLSADDWREVEAQLQWDLEMVEKAVVDATRKKRTMLSQLGARGARSLGMLLGEVKRSGTEETDQDGDSEMMG